jgi:hypothetical protein
MKKSLLFCMLTLLFGAVMLHAQSAERITTMLNTEKATYGQVAYIAAVYQDLVPESADEAQAVKALAKAGIITSSAQPADVIRLGTASFICAQATGMKGGLWYTIHPCARYAFRQLKADNIIPAAADPAMIITGRDVLGIFNGCLKNYTSDTSEASK